MSAVVAQFENIVNAKEEVIEDTSDSKGRATGRGILFQMKTFNFIVCLRIMHPILQIIIKTSKTLQSPDLDLCEAVEEIENVALPLIQMRNNKET